MGLTSADKHDTHGKWDDPARHECQPTRVMFGLLGCFWAIFRLLGHLLQTMRTFIKNKWVATYQPTIDPEHTCLSVTLKMLKIKATHNWPDKSVDMMLAYLVMVFPKDNLLPTSTYEANEVVCPLALDMKRYHACPKDFSIYYKKHENLKECSICDAPDTRSPLETMPITMCLEGKEEERWCFHKGCTVSSSPFPSEAYIW